MPVSSLIRFAALPVGAARAISSPSFSNTLIIPLSVVVLPVPGPPVKMSIPLFIAVCIASFCFSAYSILSEASTASISLYKVFLSGGGNFKSTFIRLLMEFSSRYAEVRKINSLPFISFETSLLSPMSSSIIMSALSSLVERYCAAIFTSFSLGRQVCPSEYKLWVTICTIPALSLYVGFVPLGRLCAMVSALSKPIPTPEKHKSNGFSITLSTVFAPNSLYAFMHSLGVIP